MTDEKKLRVTGYFQPGDTPTATEFEEFIDLATNASAIDAGTLGNNFLPQDITVTTLSGDGSGLTNLTAANISGQLDSSQLPDGINVDSVTATTVSGDGSGLTNLTAANISGQLDSSQLPDGIDVDSVTATTVTAATINGDGSGLTNLIAANISGQLASSQLPGGVNVDTVTATTVTATTVSGDGSGLTHLAAVNVAGQLANGNLPDEVSVNTVTATAFNGGGSGLNNLDADNINAGKVAQAYLPEGNKAARGIMRFANETELSDGADNVAITAKAMTDALAVMQTYIDQQIAGVSNQAASYSTGDGIVIEENTISVDNTALTQSFKATLYDLGFSFTDSWSHAGVQPISSDSHYGAFEYQGYLYLKVNAGNSRRLIREQRGVLDTSFAGQGYLDIPSSISGLDFVLASDKVFGVVFNRTSSRYEVYKLNLGDTPSLEKVATNDTLTSTGNGVHILHAYGDKVYVSLIDNANPSMGTGVMLFDAVNESIDIDIKVYSGKQIYGILQDSGLNIWLVASGAMYKVDGSLEIVSQAGLSGYFTGNYQVDDGNMLTYADRDGSNNVKVFRGTVDAFIADLEANADMTLHTRLPLANTLSGLSVYGAAYRANKLAVAYYITDNSTYNHYFAVYDLGTGQLDTVFNKGAPMLLDTSFYRVYYHRGYTHLLATADALVYAYQGEDSGMDVVAIP